MWTSPAIRLWTVRYRNDAATTLPLDVFTQRSFVAEFSPDVEFYWKKTVKSRFVPPFGKLRGYVCTRFIMDAG